MRDGWGTRFVVPDGREANTEADPPFGFAQGRLFGDENKKGKRKDKDKNKDTGIDGYWMVRLMVAVWITEPPVAVTLMA